MDNDITGLLLLAFVSYVGISEWMKGVFQRDRVRRAKVAANARPDSDAA
jgi:hypothetical protein